MSAGEVTMDMKIKKKCVVPGCFGKNKDGNNAPLHRLPWHKQDLAKKWLSNLLQAGIPRGKLTLGCRVCGEHFEGGRMGPNDVPVFPSSSAREIFAATSMLQLGDDPCQTPVHTPLRGSLASCTSTSSDAVDIHSPLSSMHEKDGEGMSHVMDMHDQNLATPPTTGARPRSRKRILADADTQVTPPKRISTATYKTPPRSSGCQKTPTKKRNVHTQVARRKDSATYTGSFNSHSLVDKCVGNHTDMCDKQVQVSHAPLSIELIQHNDRDIAKYTGLESYTLFKIVHKYATAHCHQEQCQIQSHQHGEHPAVKFRFISTENQLLVTLYKLRSNPTEYLIGKQFGIGTGSVSQIFHVWITLLYRKFKLLNIAAPLIKIQESMPENVKLSCPNLREIYDATEIFSQKPSDPIAQKQMWSNYKHHHTVKVQIGCDPAGVITSISDAYGGLISDKELFAQSKVVDKLEEGDAIMVDKGYLINDLLQGKGVQLIRPSFMKDGDQFEEKEMEVNRKTSRIRIVIENVNARIKNFKILSQTLSVKFLPMANEIIYVCASLTNLHPPPRKPAVP